MTPTRERGLALGLLAAGGALVLAAAAAGWVVATASAEGLPAVSVEVTGGAAAPALPALGLLALAGVVGVVATRGRLRRVVGGALAAAGAAVVVVAVSTGRSPVATARAPLAEQLGVDAVEPTAVTSSAWWLVAVLGGLLVLGGGALSALRGHRWSALSARYGAAGRADDGRVDAGSPDDGRAGRAAGPAQAWDALDRGEDPTLAPGDGGDLPQ